MGAQTAVRIALAIFGAAVIWIGVGLAAFAVVTALTEPLGLAWAAGITAALLLAPPLLWMLVTALRRPAPTPKANGAGATNPILALLAATAEETPLLAVLGAGLFGVAEALRNGDRRR